MLDKMSARRQSKNSVSRSEMNSDRLRTEISAIRTPLNSPSTKTGFSKHNNACWYSSRQTNSAGRVRELYYSNGGTLNLDTNTVNSE